MTIGSVLYSGYLALMEYIVAHTLTCLIPAFFIAGAIAAFVSKDSVLKYFGPKANKFLAYGVASISGAILAVCSCTVLPLFAGIHRKGAGLGPAIAFLYSGPAINILAMVYTARLLGFDIGLARAIGAVSFAAIIGLIMALIFHEEEKEKEAKAEVPLFAANGDGKTSDWHRLAFLVFLIAILLTATARVGDLIKWSGVAIEILLVVYACRYWFAKEEVSHWLNETWKLARLIVPILLIGVFFAGMIKAMLPPAWVARFVGGNTVTSNFIASFSGALMYFATLTEVPIIKALMELGMGRGPVLALLLAGPALSLPSMLAIGRILGVKKTAVYVLLVVVFATITGLAFGALCL